MRQFVGQNPRHFEIEVLFFNEDLLADTSVRNSKQSRRLYTGNRISFLPQRQATDISPGSPISDEKDWQKYQIRNSGVPRQGSNEK
jgi:hypothetical protein